MAVWDVKQRYNLTRANDVKGTRGFQFAGQSPSATISSIDVVTIETKGNASDFGDITIATNQLGGGNAGSATRSFARLGGENSGGYYTTPCEVIDSTASTGNSTTFGTLTVGASTVGTFSSAVRSCQGGGAVAPNGDPQNVINYFTISTFGNSTDFGDLTVARSSADGLASPTRGIFCGGFVSPNTMKNEMDYVTIASTGNATDFGDLNVNRRNSGTGSNQTRGIIAGGQVPGNTAQADFITIASTGNSTDFGDLTVARQTMGISNQINFLCAGGSSPGFNVIDEVKFSNLGNFTDFGDLTRDARLGLGGSTGHGGLDDNNYINLQRPSVTYMPGSGRALMSGGQTAPADALVSTVEMCTISTAGNLSNFGDLASVSSNMPGNGASVTRSIVYSGYSPASPYYNNTIQAVEFASLGNYFDFGDPTQQRYALSSGNVGSPTRGVFMGGYAPGSPYFVNIIDYVTIATIGNGTDFGDLATATNNTVSCGSSTRGVCLGGYTGSQDDTIQYVTIASTGNATDFGNLTAAKSGGTGVSSSTRGIMAGGTTGSITNVIEYITIASTGNGTDFGDLTQARKSFASGSNSTRGVFMGGSTPSKVNTVDFITIATTGNATDFGDVSIEKREAAGTCDAHGGLQ